ncbi:MAG: hypothetical protein OXK17_03930 [Thaumarchaeota archaeon]|nr:hypothetical protein [Nitrososphaerota archaeon]
MAAGTEASIFEALVRYALSEYGDAYEEVVPDCPYETRMGGDRAFLQEVSYFVYEWVNPATSTTILEEFVGRRVRNRKQAARLLRRKDVVRGTFEVVSAGGGGSKTVTVRSTDTRAEYVMLVPIPVDRYAPGAEFVGRIHPRDGDTYAACGVLTRPGEWDGERLVAVAEAAGLAGEDLQKAKHMASINARTRSGRSNSYEDVVRLQQDVSKILKTPESKLADDPLMGLGSDAAMELVEDVRKRKDDFESAMSARTSPDVDLRSVLSGYPTSLLRTICHESDTGSLQSRDAMIERLSDRIPAKACDALQRMSENERRALALVVHSGHMPYPDCRRVLCRFADDLFEDEDPDDPKLADGFVRHYAETGMLSVGTIMQDGRAQRAVSVHSDVRERLLECHGWGAYLRATALMYSEPPTRSPPPQTARVCGPD